MKAFLQQNRFYTEIRKFMILTWKVFAREITTIKEIQIVGHCICTIQIDRGFDTDFCAG